MRSSKINTYRLLALVVPLALVWFAPTAAAQVTVTVDVTGDAVPGGTVAAAATVDITDGSTLQSYGWSQKGGVDAAITGANTAQAMLTLGALGQYKTQLFEVLAEPPVDAEDLPENVPLPEGEFPGGLQNRFDVVGLNPFSIEEAGLVEVALEVTTTSGTYVTDVDIHTVLPWKTTAGIRNVPIGRPVLLHGKNQATYDWALAAPGGSGAMLMDATAQNPEFVPDVAGLYTLTVTEDTGDPTATKVVTLPIYAGTWRGVIVGQDAEGRPVSDGACTGCHSGFAPDLFTPWKDTGHAEIFTDNLDTSTHYGEGCFSCHSVGWDPGVANGGFDDAPDYADFLNAGLLNVPGDNWTTMLNQFPAAAKLANIQCENCHGPQSGSDAHGPSGPMGEPRYSISSDVCAQCHGEPLRHARFQQWQLSRHANYELAIDESQSGSCSRCHTGNGFLTWLPILLDDDPATDPTANITVDWTLEETHPQTCVTCHDPHRIGTTSGANEDANVYISNDTPPLIAGFQAIGVGRGAICMTCHNSRRGLFNDNVFAGIYGTSDASRAPHGSAQADVLMGQNGFFVTPGNRGNHSLTSNVEDTCVTCHMESTPPPDVLSYNQGGSNHTFFARTDICGECHGFEDASFVQDATKASLAVLEANIETAILDLINEQIQDGNTVTLGSAATLTGTGDVKEIQLEESRGRQAITVTLADDTVVGPTGMNSVDVVPPMGDSFDIYDVANPNLVKAGWNYWLASNDGSYGVHNPTFIASLLSESIAALDQQAPECINDGNTLCLNQDRFQVDVTWRDFQNNIGSGTVLPFRSDDSGLFYFFTENNWEVLLKVLDGCSVNNNYWVFFAATTNVEFTVTVTDTKEDITKVYTNQLGQAANAITDTSAFATCP